MFYCKGGESNAYNPNSKVINRFFADLVFMKFDPEQNQNPHFKFEIKYC